MHHQMPTEYQMTDIYGNGTDNHRGTIWQPFKIQPQNVSWGIKSDSWPQKNENEKKRNIGRNNPSGKYKFHNEVAGCLYIYG